VIYSLCWTWIMLLIKHCSLLHVITGIVLCTITGHRMRMNWSYVKEILCTWWRSVTMVGMWGQVKEQATLVPSLAIMLREYEVSIGCIIELGYTPIRWLPVAVQCKQCSRYKAVWVSRWVHVYALIFPTFHHYVIHALISFGQEMISLVLNNSWFTATLLN